MKVLTLGWEYPPHISGGLGTACQGLTKGLSRLGTDITFVVPYLWGDEQASHMKLLSADAPPITSQPTNRGRVEYVGIPAMLKPYWNTHDFKSYIDKLSVLPTALQDLMDLPAFAQATTDHTPPGQPKAQYGCDLFEEIGTYTARVMARISQISFDLIHAHDWMTYPAGLALSRATGKPLIVHVHSIERDRSGDAANWQICEIERIGLDGATTIIAVSHYTKSALAREYQIPIEKIQVVHNGLYPKAACQHYRSTDRDEAGCVLFLGRVTFQKGPDYFIRAAAKAAPYLPDTRFVMAGSGDMLSDMIDLSVQLGVRDRFSFPGFLCGEEVEAALASASLYVMPSVSEPFGIVPLEAISLDTPALISRQSGVSEVIRHTLKFDFWDVDRLTDLMINGIRHGELRRDMVDMARKELQHLSWDRSASRTLDIYRQCA